MDVDSHIVGCRGQYLQSRGTAADDFASFVGNGDDQCRVFVVHTFNFESV